MQNFFKHWVRFLYRFYLLFLLLGLTLGAVSIPRMVELFKHISTDPVDLLPQNYPSVQTLLQVRDKMEPKRRFGLALESENPEKTRQLLEDLKPLLRKSPYVGEVYTTKLGYEFFDKHKMYYLDLKDLKEIRERLDRRIQQEKLHGLYISLEDEEDQPGQLNFSDLEAKYRERAGGGSSSPYYLSPNGKTYGLYVESREPNLDLGQERKFEDSIRQIVGSVDLKAYDPTMKLYFGGSARVMEYRSLMHDLKLAGIISGILIFVPLLLRFRWPQYVLLIFLPLAFGIPAGLALSSIWVHKLNVTTSFLFAILGGLGVETGIHLFSRYREKRLEGEGIQAALLDLYCFLGPAILTAVASLAVTFLLLAVSDFKGFSEFGIISGIGLWTVFLYYFTFFPSLLVASEKLRLLRFKPAEKEREFQFQVSPSFVKTLLAIFSLFTLFSLVVTPRIQFEYNSKKIRADDPGNREAKQKQRSTTGKRVNNPAVVIIHSPEEAEAIAEALRHRKEANPQSTLDYTSSLYSLMPKQQEEKAREISGIQMLLEDDALKLLKGKNKEDLDRFKLALKESIPVLEAQIPAELKQIFLGRPDSVGSLLLVHAKPQLELDDGRNAMAFAAEVENIQTPLGEFHASNDAIVFGDVLKTMFRDSTKVFAISVASIFFFVFLNFRDLKKTLLVMFSICAGLAWVMGVLYLTGIKLNLYNMVMLPAVMGMSIDNSIHIYHSYEELGKGSLSKVLATAGLSSLLASTTNAAGFLGLVFCTHGGLRSMGIVASIGLITCLVSTLVFLPMILQYIENWKADGASEALPSPAMSE